MRSGEVAAIYRTAQAQLADLRRQRVTALLKQSDLTLNLGTRIKLVNRAGKIMADDVPMIPLFQRTTYFVYKAPVHGIVDNAGPGGPSWNAEAWSKG
jgi:ABC-type transport system substrate-binding protein